MIFKPQILKITDFSQTFAMFKENLHRQISFSARTNYFHLAEYLCRRSKLAEKMCTFHHFSAMRDEMAGATKEFIILMWTYSCCLAFGWSMIVFAFYSSPPSPHSTECCRDFINDSLGEKDLWWFNQIYYVSAFEMKISDFLLAKLAATTSWRRQASRAKPKFIYGSIMG